MSTIAKVRDALAEAKSAGMFVNEWDYIASNRNHGPYIADNAGSVCDFYSMSNPLQASMRNGGESYPIHFQSELADINAKFVAACNPEVVQELLAEVDQIVGEMGVLATALNAIVKRSLDNTLGTSKVIDMRNIAQRALGEEVTR